MAKPEDFAKKIERAGKILHDDIGPLLSAAGLRLQLLKMDFPATAAQVREVTEALDDVMERIRKLSQELAPSPFSTKRAPKRAKRGYN